MGRQSLFPAFCLFFKNDRIPLHHVPRNGRITGKGGVRHQVPAMPIRLLEGDPYRIVVVAGRSFDTGAEIGDGFGPCITHAGMDENNAAASKGVRPPCDRAAVVAVRGAGHRDACNDFFKTALRDIRRRDVSANFLRYNPLQKPRNRVGAPQRLEAFQSEPAGFVLVQNALHVQFPGHPGQIDQRGRPVTRPAGDRACCLPPGIEVEDLSSRCAVGLIHARPAVHYNFRAGKRQ